MILETNNLEDLNELKTKYEAGVLGYFDGVHLGHQKLLETFSDGLLTVNKGLVITFKFKKTLQKQLLSEEEKINRIKQSIGENVKNYDILILDLEPNIINIPKERFIVFLESLGLKNLFVGSDYKFGAGAGGSVQDLKQYFSVNVVNFVMSKNGIDKIGTKFIKDLLQKRKIKEANEELGYKYFVDGMIIHGKALGRKLGFRTANIIPGEMLPANGVYITNTIINGEKFHSVTSIGLNSTIESSEQKQVVCETHILDSFSKDVYNEDMRVIFVKFLREEKKFNNVEELKKQINEDIKYTEEYYES